VVACYSGTQSGFLKLARISPRLGKASAGLIVLKSATGRSVVLCSELRFPGEESSKI
jgi:hypothetical protein